MNENQPVLLENGLIGHGESANQINGEIDYHRGLKITNGAPSSCLYDFNKLSITTDTENPCQQVTNKSLTYGSYLKIPELLKCVEPQSTKAGSPVHDEHLFIVTHHTYELWFKQILFELDSVRKIFMNEMGFDERHTMLVCRRLDRVILILKLLCSQFEILETMTPHDFMAFRPFLGESSGFQSLQFRLLENKLGVLEEMRIKYNKCSYSAVFTAAEDRALLEDSVTQSNLLQLVERWLERTPGLEQENMFMEDYKQACEDWVEDEFHTPALDEKDPELRAIKMAEFEKQKNVFVSAFDQKAYQQSVAKGERRISFQAFLGALLISSHRDEPRFNQPFQILSRLTDIDSILTKWRYNHVMMVQRMLGSKAGTGGSSGYLYLRSTISDRYKVFVDLFNLSTYLIPRDRIPRLNSKTRRRLSTMDETVDLYYMHLAFGESPHDV